MVKQMNYPIYLTEVLRARSAVYNYLVPTQLTKYNNLSSLLACLTLMSTLSMKITI